MWRPSAYTTACILEGCHNNKSQVFRNYSPPHNFAENYQVLSYSYFQGCYLKFLLRKFLKHIFRVIIRINQLHTASCFQALQHRNCIETMISISSLQVDLQYLPCLNVCENTGSTLKNHAEGYKANYGRIPYLTGLQGVVTDMLREKEFDSQLFCDLLISYPSRMQVVVQGGGDYTKY